MSGTVLLLVENGEKLLILEDFTLSKTIKLGFSAGKNSRLASAAYCCRANRGYKFLSLAIIIIICLSSAILSPNHINFQST